MRFFSTLMMFIASVTLAQNLVTNPDMKQLNDQGKPVGWNQFQKGNLRIPGDDGADFTLFQPDDKDATITSNINPEPNVPYTFSFQAKSTEGSLMHCYFEWFKNISGKRVYGGGASVKKRTAPTEWTAYTVPFMLPDDFHYGYVAMRSLNGKALSIKGLEVKRAATQKDVDTGGLWNLDALKERFTAKGVIVRNDEPATLFSIPVESGKSYSFSYDACGNGPIDPAYPFHEIKIKFIPSMQGGISANDVSNTPQRKFHKFKVPEGRDITRLSVEFGVNTRSSQAEVLFSNMKLEEIIPDPRDDWRFEMVKPFYRDVIFESQALEAMECQLLTDGNAASCEVEFNGEQFRQPVNGDRDVRITIPIKELKDGAYSLTCKVRDQDDKVLKSFSKKILKVPPAPVEVICKEDRYMYVNGEPFFPNMMNMRGWSEDYVYYAARHGVNLSITRPGATEEETLKRLDLAEKYGMKVVLNGGWADGKAVSYDTFRKKLEEMFTPAVRRHPAFLFYFMIDEPFWGGKPFEPLQKTYEIYREFDPYHPVWINAAPRGEITDLRPYADACDVYGCDIYPVPAPNSHSGLEDKMMTSVGKYTERMNEVTRWRKPILMILQGFGWGENPECGPLGRAKYHPSQEEMRFMLFDTMVNGATGVEQWGTNHVKDADFLELVLDTCEDLHAFSGLFLHGKQLPNAAATSAALRASVWEYQGNLTYFIMNVTDKDAEGVVDVADKPLIDLMSWGGTLKSTAAGKMTVALKPYAFMVYGTAPLPPPWRPLTAKNAEFEAQGSPIPGAIQKTLEPYKGKKNFTTTANWVWQGQEALMNGNVCYVAKKFNVAAGEKVQLKLAVDDLSTVFVNGKQIGETKGWSELFIFDLTDKVKAGENLLMIRAADTGGLPCGVLAELHVGKTILLSDSTWLGMPVKGIQAPVPATLDGFKPVTIIQAYGGGAWRNNVMTTEK